MNNNMEYYNILKVPKTASDKEIKKSYHKLSRLYHPDKNPGKKTWAEENFKKVSEAYAVLSDEKKRKLYDQGGKEAVERGEHVDNDFPFPFPFGNMHRRQQIPATKIAVKITLEQAFTGGEFTHTFNRKKTCFDCSGHGTKSGKPSDCSNCNGRGIQVRVIRMGHMIQQTQTPCDKCQGTGECVDAKYKCKECKGNGSVKEKCSFKFTVEPGTVTGLQMKTEKGTKGHDLKPKAQKEFGGREFTELIIVAKVKNHHLYEVKNRFDLVYHKKITLASALTGTNFKIKGINGKDIIINKKDIIKDQSIYEIKGKGMPILERFGGNGSRRGSLYVVFEYEYPESLTNEQSRVILETMIPGSSWKQFEENPEKCSMKLVNERKQKQNNLEETDNDDSSSDSNSDSDDEDIGEKLRKHMNSGEDMPQGVQCAQQ